MTNKYKISYVESDLTNKEGIKNSKKMKWLKDVNNSLFKLTKTQT